MGWVKDIFNNEKHRSIAIQILAACLLIGTIFWLLSNVVANLQVLGRDFSFDFLSNRAGYDINQTLIPYDNSMPHARAALVGILNTFLVAILACISATFLGVAMGVLRLSKVAIIAKLAAVYVEGFRNIPLLFWIILIFALLTEATPQPRDFRAGGEASMLLFNTIAISNRGMFVPAPVWGNWTWMFGVVLVLSIMAAMAFKRYALSQKLMKGVAVPVGMPVIAILILPISVAFALLGSPVHFTLPELAGFNFQGGWQIRNSLVALWFALALYTGAFIAEVVRAGILSVEKGQFEAATALGLRPYRTLTMVIIPQAMRVIIPPLITQYISIVKNSSLAIAVGYMDVRATLGGITINQTGRILEGMLLLGIFYLSVSLLISGVLNIYNRHVRWSEQ